MKLTWLCWYLSGYVALLCLGASFVTVVPEKRNWLAATQAVLAVSTVAMAALAIRLERLPETHWVHRSGSPWAEFVVAITGFFLVFGCLF
jgi:hypothetical protein